MNYRERDITVTLKGEEWFALMAALANKPLSPEGTTILRRAKTRLATQLRQSADVP